MANAPGRFVPLLVLMLLAVPASVSLADGKPDLSNPKGAAKAFGVAMQNGDIATVKASSIGSDADYNMIAALAQFVAAGNKLRDASVARFGPEQGKTILQATEPADIAKRVDESEQTIDGDSASLAKKGGSAGDTLRLKKVDGQWKVDLNTLPGKQQMAQQLPVMKAMEQVMSDGAADIRAGKFKNAEEARQQIQQRVLAALAGAAH